MGPMRLNTPRFLAAALAAGVLINASGMALVHFALGPDYVKAFFSHMAHEPGPATFAKHLGTRFMFGAVAAALVVGLTPRFRRRSSAAIGAALAIYLTAYLPTALLLNDYAVLTGRDLWITLAWSTAEILLASLLAAAIYRDHRPVRVDTIAADPTPRPDSGTTAA